MDDSFEKYLAIKKMEQEAAKEMLDAVGKTIVKGMFLACLTVVAVAIINKSSQSDSD